VGRGGQEGEEHVCRHPNDEDAARVQDPRRTSPVFVQELDLVLLAGGRVGVGLGEEAGTEGIGIKSLGEAGGIAVARRLPTCNPLGDPLSQLMEEALVAGMGRDEAARCRHPTVMERQGGRKEDHRALGRGTHGAALLPAGDTHIRGGPSCRPRQHQFNLTQLPSSRWQRLVSSASSL